MYNLLSVIFFSIIKYFHPLLVRECAWVELGRWRAIFLTNPSMTSWKNFNPLPNPLIYKSNGSVENLNGFNLAG